MSRSRKDQLRDFIQNTLLENMGVGTTTVDNHTSLFEEKLLDSLSLVSLIAFLEESFGIKLKSMDIVLENLDTIDLMDAMVERKLRS